MEIEDEFETDGGITRSLSVEIPLLIGRWEGFAGAANSRRFRLPALQGTFARCG
jgi:hypothetical protein